MVAGDAVVRDERAIRAVEYESDSGQDPRGRGLRGRAVRAVVVPEFVVRDPVVGRDLRLTAVDHVDDHARRVADRAVVRHADVLTVLDLKADLTVGGLVVVDQDLLVLPGVEAGVRVGAGRLVPRDPAVRGPHGEHGIGQVGMRLVPLEPESVDTREVNAEALEAAHGEARELEVCEPQAAHAARRQLDVGGGQRIGRRHPDALGLCPGLLEHDRTTPARRPDETDAVLGHRDGAAVTRLVVRARLDADGRARGRGVDGRLDRPPGVDDDRPGGGRRASGESQRERESAGGTGHASLLGVGYLRYAADKGPVNESRASRSAVEDLSCPTCGRGKRTAWAPSLLYSPRSAASTCSGCFAASLTRAQCLRTLPSGPIHTVERMTPTVFLPYIIFS